MRARWIVLLGACLMGVVLLLLLLWLPAMPAGGNAAQQQPSSSQTLAVGPYISAIHLFENPPQVGQPLNISIVPRNSGHLSGQIIAVPQPGTDSTPTHVLLSPDPGRSNALAGSLQLPVRGAWRLLIELDGSQGHGTASLDVTAVVPFVLPPWLGWLLGLSPLVGCAWLIWHQWCYRRQLLTSARSV
jgi:hypothetical protein